MLEAVLNSKKYQTDHLCAFSYQAQEVTRSLNYLNDIIIKF